ncbi:MAG: hypothetical protein ABJE95_03440 [Byssovorax sp.]
MKTSLRLKHAYPALLVPLLSLCIWCGGGGETSGDSTVSASAAGPSIPSTGPAADGGVVDDDSGPGQENLDAAPPDAGEPGDAAPCDDSKGDLEACAAPGPGAACLTASRCQALAQLLSPRSAGAAMSCIADLGDACAPELLGACFLGAAALACAPAAPGSSPCDAVASTCAAGDPSGLVSGCLDFANALSPTARTGLAACFGDAGACDATALTACAATLIP